MHRMGAQVHGLGANEPTCTPLATPLDLGDAQGGNREVGNAQNSMINYEISKF